MFGCEANEKITEIETRPLVPEISSERSVPKMATSTQAEVPFFSQAPFADWADIRQQDGCEEATMLMAYLWYHNLEVSRQSFLDSLIDLTEFEITKFGAHNDIAANDMVTVLKEKLMVPNAYAIIDSEKVTIELLKELLTDGNLVIAPTQGQRLGNPNYSGAGPERHALLILGFDDDKKEFIVHDPGTRKGENYRYDYDVLLNALLSYPTGEHLPIMGEAKTLVVVPPKSSS